MLQGMLQMLEKLSCESNNRHWKINAIKDKIESIQYDFVSLKQRLVLLESANTKIMNNPHTCAKYAQSTADELADIKTSLDEASATLGRVEGFLHPCSGSGWRQVVNFDMTDPDTNCPSPWVENTSPDGIRTCGRFTTGFGCDTVTLTDINEPYSEVCGRVRGYQRGSPQAFDLVPPSNRGFTDPFLDGLVLIRDFPNDPEHIWTFAAGARQQVLTSPPGSHCPCLVGEVEFEMTVGAIFGFLNGHFFCESALPDIGEASPTLPPLVGDIVASDPLWDGLGCNPNSNCCNFGTPPYFTRVLEGAKDSDIQARLCFVISSAEADIGIELIEIYVR